MYLHNRSSSPYTRFHWDDGPELERELPYQILPSGRFKKALAVLALIGGTTIMLLYNRYPQYSKVLGFEVIRKEPSSNPEASNANLPPDPNERISRELWTWTCEDDRCKRTRVLNDTLHLQSLLTCNMLCTKTPIWPKTHEWLDTSFSKNIVPISDTFDLEIVTSSSKEVTEHIEGAFSLFKGDVQKLIKNNNSNDSAKRMRIKVSVENNPDPRMTTSTDEMYRVLVEVKNGSVIATLVTFSFVGAARAFETLAQLIWYDTNLNCLVTYDKVEINDAPKNDYRGLLLDTARNYFPVEDIKRTIDAMAATKLNTFHWHATDSQSFPLQLNSAPLMAAYGAYSRKEVYTRTDIKDIVKHARLRGIRVIIEVDVPAHVGRGWSWGKAAGLGELAYCVESSPWNTYCGEPPCGQLNPNNEHVYQFLEKIYAEIIELTGVDDIFHIGGDEVNANCWSSHMPNVNSVEAWYAFTQKATKALQNANKGKLPKHVIIWSSKLTKTPYLSKMKNYTVQIWGPTVWADMKAIPESVSSIIVSHVDAWYLDCGYGSWRNEGGGSCEVLRTWQKVYNFRPWAGLGWPMFGGEACMWSELLGPEDLDARLWPRAAALGERLWTDPDSGVTDDVYHRLDMHRSRLLKRGIAASPLWPRWCTDNPYECPYEYINIEKRATSSGIKMTFLRHSSSVLNDLSFCLIYVAVALLNS